MNPQRRQFRPRYYAEFGRVEGNNEGGASVSLVYVTLASITMEEAIYIHPLKIRDECQLEFSSPPGKFP